MTTIPDSISVPASVIDEIPTPTAGTGDLTDQLIGTDVWTAEMLQQAGIPIVETDFVSVGGGMGSFVMVNYLRIAGVPTDRIKVLTNIERPWDTYEYLTRVSQIPRPERLRSDSQGRPDCLWGFPSYAYREAKLEKTLAPIVKVTTEPFFFRYWTPRAGTVFNSLEAEMQRMRYQEMQVLGTARMVRKCASGGYFTILTPPPGTSPTKRVAYHSKHVHLAIGYPGLKFLPDLQEYRTKYNDLARTVNAYEPHEHIYDGFMRKPSVVLVRGGGIVASRVLQRIMEDRMNKGAPQGASVPISQAGRDVVKSPTPAPAAAPAPPAPPRTEQVPATPSPPQGPSAATVVNVVSLRPVVPGAPPAPPAAPAASGPAGTVVAGPPPSPVTPPVPGGSDTSDIARPRKMEREKVERDVKQARDHISSALSRMEEPTRRPETPQDARAHLDQALAGMSGAEDEPAAEPATDDGSTSADDTNTPAVDGTVEETPAGDSRRGRRLFRKG